MSPTEAMKVAAVWRLTPGTVISRSTSGQASACLAISRSRAATSVSRKSIWRRQPSRVSRSSTGRSSAASQRRPALPKQSVTGGRSQRLRASTPCASFLARVRARTRLSRRAHTRRSAGLLVGRPHRLKHPGRGELGKRPRVEPVSLGLGPADLRQLARVGYQHPRDMALEHVDDQPRAAGRFQRHHVVARQALREQLQLGDTRRDPARRPDSAVLTDRDLAEVAMDVHPR